MNGSVSPRVVRFLLAAAVALFAVGLRAAPAGQPDVVVAADGTGRFKTIREAIDAAPQFTRESGRRWTILVKPGIYHELVYVQREKRFITLVGESREKTILTYDLHASLSGPDDKSIGMARTPTLTIDADDFTLENLTIENSAGPRGPAIALRADGERVIVRRCRILGWQNTLLVNRGRQYFEECHIEGAIDFIAGGGTAFFERCQIRSMGPGHIAAASTPDVQAFGFVFSNCSVAGANAETKTFLARPWRDFAKVVFLNTAMTEVVQPAAWDNGKKVAAEKSAFFAEYGSTGMGASASARVPWSRQLNTVEAANYTREKVLAGADNWDPTRVPKRERKR